MQILDGHLILSASDLVGHLACGHLTVLEREAAEGGKTRPIRRDPALHVLAKRGFERSAVVTDQTLTEKIRSLPPEKVAEVEEFVDFPRTGNDGWRLTRPATKLCQDAFAKVWDNPDDADYDRL